MERPGLLRRAWPREGPILSGQVAPRRVVQNAKMEATMIDSAMHADGYASHLGQGKGRRANAQLRVRLAGRCGLIGLYRQLGKLMIDRQRAEGWGTKVVERLSADPGAGFPDMRGVSRRNPMYSDSWLNRPVSTLLAVKLRIAP
jgi:hypothetical protein